MNIESLRDSNQVYREIIQSNVNMLLLARDNLMRFIFHCHIIGIMVILTGFSVLVPAYFSQYLIIEHLILGIIIIITISTIFFLVEYIMIPYSLIDNCIIIQNESIIQMQTFRLCMPIFENLDSE